MGKDDKEESGFGFKDKAKAEETLRLLAEHDMRYSKLTVRGLLRRAKRVLSLTKAEEKIKNIKEAMQVFEDWLAENEDNKNEGEKKVSKKKEEEKKENGDEKQASSDVEMEEPQKKDLPSETVPGKGFKDREAAETTLKILEGRDPEYQKLSVKSLIQSAKRVLRSTRDETKISNIKEAISVLEKFIEDYNAKDMDEQNNRYLSLSIVKTAAKLAGDDISEQQKSFIAAYASVNGEYRRLRNVPEKEGGTTWDIVRNVALKELKEKYSECSLFEGEYKPTKEHIQMLLWAYSPEASVIKKRLPLQDETESSPKEESVSRKRKSSAQDEDSPNKKHKD